MLLTEVKDSNVMLCYFHVTDRLLEPIKEIHLKGQVTVGSNVIENNNSNMRVIHFEHQD